MKDTRMESGAAGAALGAETASRVRAALARSRRIVEARPERATGTAVTRAGVLDGMTCEVSEGECRVVYDLPERWGGADRGPNPGFFGRGALGACLSMAYVRWAAEQGLPLRSLEVEVRAQYDARGELGVGEVSPAYARVDYVVHVDSPAPEDEVRRVFDVAEARCPYLKIFADPIPVRRELRLAAAGPEPVPGAATAAAAAGER